MAQPLRDNVEITNFDIHRPCTFCGSADCDPDEMDIWVTHMATWHGYKVVEDTPASRDGERPRKIKLQLVGWSEHARFKANQHVTVRAGVQQRDFVGRKGTVVGYNPSTAQFAVSFAENPTYGVMEPGDLDPYVSER